MQHFKVGEQMHGDVPETSWSQRWQVSSLLRSGCSGLENEAKWECCLLVLEEGLKYGSQHTLFIHPFTKLMKFIHRLG